MVRRAAIALVAVCAAGCPSGPAREPAAPRAPAPPSDVAAKPVAVLQTLLASHAKLSGDGSSLLVRDDACRAAIVDTTSRVVMAHARACDVWPNPKRDTFALRPHRSEPIVVFSDRGARRIAIAAEGRSEPQWSRDGRRLAVMVDDNTLAVVNEDGRDPIRVPVRYEGAAPVDPPSEHRFEVRLEQDAWRADDEQIALSGRGVQLFDVRRRRLADLPETCDGQGDPRFAPRGDILAVRCRDHSTELWDTRTMQRTGKVAPGHVRAFSKDGATLAVEHDDGVTLHDARTGALRATITTKSEREVASMSPDASRVAVYLDGALDVRDTLRGSSLRLPESRWPEWSADGRFFAGVEGGAEPAVVVRDGARFDAIDRFPISNRSYFVWSPAGARLAMPLRDDVTIVDPAKREVSRIPELRPKPPRTLTMAPDGKELAWSFVGGGVLLRAGRGAARVQSDRVLEWHWHDEAIVATVGSDRGCRFVRWPRDADAVTLGTNDECGALSPDEARFASRDKVRDVASGRIVARFPAAPPRYWTVDFPVWSADGRTVTRVLSLDLGLDECRLRTETIDAATGKLLRAESSTVILCKQPDFVVASTKGVAIPIWGMNDARTKGVVTSGDGSIVAVMTDADVRLFRAGDEGIRAFTMLETPGGDELVAIDTEGRVAGSDAALAHVRWHGEGVVESLTLASAEKRFGARRAALFDW